MNPIFRQYLAAIHYNENSDREILCDEMGDPKLFATFPKKKHKQGAFSLRTKKTSPTYGNYYVK